MGKTILAVDDSASIRQMVSFTLKSSGYEVIEAVDGMDGLDKAKAKSVALEHLERVHRAAIYNKTGEVRHLAHSCAGASATLGMNRLLTILQELERQGVDGALVNAEPLCADAAREFKRIKAFLARPPSLAATTTTIPHS